MLAELILTSALKFSGALRLKILVHLTSRDRIGNMYPSRNPRGVALPKPFKEGAKHPKNLFPERFEESPGLNPRNRFAISGDDIFWIRFGVNSPRLLSRKMRDGGAH